MQSVGVGLGMVCMELRDLADADKVNGHFSTGDFFLLKEKLNEFSHRRNVDWQV